MVFFSIGRIGCIQKIEYKYLGAGILVVVLFDMFHVVGDILFYFMNDSRTPIYFGISVLYYLPLLRVYL
ncbi:MAG: hypothetical protein Q6363_010405 [Candidatus Njordarchaeota archaeon]